MGQCTGKRKQSYVNHPRDRSKPTCLIYGHGNSSDECKLQTDFGTKYVKSRPFKERKQYPTSNKKFEKDQEVNAIFQHAVNEIILQETEKGNASLKNENHDHENIHDEIYKKRAA